MCPWCEGTPWGERAKGQRPESARCAGILMGHVGIVSRVLLSSGLVLVVSCPGEEGGRGRDAVIRGHVAP
eukprot:4986576-Prymnesium_polylepis.1